ncbi:unnamed protein product [Pedinophyceae sp. YPF-701]|nr:unnamed protein product [Pedinophyceae sp. YPF-701]
MSALTSAVRPTLAKPCTASRARAQARVASRTARPAPRQAVVAAVSPVEVAQVAGEAGFIGGTAATMFGMTLVGLALGFVLLRVESLVEEGKINL